jgi:purine-binding chemotaxis protein CheW
MSSDFTRTGPEDRGTRILLVDVHGGVYGLAGDHVREIVSVLPPTRLPGAPPWVRGVVNLRGQLLTVVDLGHRLTGKPTGSPDASTVVVQVDERSLGVIVDDVHDVQQLEVLPADRDALARAEGLVTGLGRLGEEVVLVIDVPELVRQTLA